MNVTKITKNYSLSRSAFSLLFFISLLLVGFGQPAWNSICAILASCCGYALFFRTLLAFPHLKHRFWLATFWFGTVQLIQLSWMISHPYWYIYSIYFLLSFAIGMQFGLIVLWIQPFYIRQFRWLFGLAGLWVLMEWIRLFILSGFSFNPIGLALTSTIYSLQFASLWGIYGLSFWVMFVNLLALKIWNDKFNLWNLSFYFIAALFPYLFGFIHIQQHDRRMSELSNTLEKPYNAVLVQTSFPIEESLGIKDPKLLTAYVINEWRQILTITKKNLGKKIDLLVLPEFVVPYGTYSCVYPFVVVSDAFKEIFGKESLSHLPPLQSPLATQVKSRQGSVWMVNNAYWTQALANIFQTEVVAGLEDAEKIESGKTEYYSSAIHFLAAQANSTEFQTSRYEKRVLVPMGEYIPFTFLSKLAEKYGIYGSFTPGKEAKVFRGKKVLGLSICYEETYGHLMRENKQKGAEILVNLTSDAWYPNSRLVQQHFDHARLRTVENGLPLLRACNTGITAGLDSLGRIVKELTKKDTNVELISDSLLVALPTYSYSTLYSHFGDTLIILLSFLALLFCFFSSNSNPKTPPN
jgi:apolipoprotein N-acyltransferase